MLQQSDKCYSKAINVTVTFIAFLQYSKLFFYYICVCLMCSLQVLQAFVVYGVCNQGLFQPFFEADYQTIKTKSIFWTHFSNFWTHFSSFQRHSSSFQTHFSSFWTSFSSFWTPFSSFWTHFLSFGHLFEVFGHRFHVFGHLFQVIGLIFQVAGHIFSSFLTHF